MFWAGMIQGLIHDIPTVQALIDDIMAEANDIIASKLSRLVG